MFSTNNSTLKISALLFHSVGKVLVVGCFCSGSQANERDQFEVYDCAKYIKKVDTIAEFKENGYLKSDAMKIVSIAKDIQFTRAVVSVYEFQKALNRKELALYTLGWCEGHNDTIPQQGFIR